ncbi:uncharacterized protein C8Q71DRAFT_795353 [Rhodofomes roseus]|uniref:Uncharacterized protein n=1 Tax=Rhodofomes roseus TaxID=34475 RepID=A0ABQ8KPW7_9APHY|nr:uncharacterized protein C8Q71DRAFT_795353 [Rhodofomes roseus]KAH9840233.1 hypothetical protein C8Q71DRAFT_795353 [Rhodofomes roseus]
MLIGHAADSQQWASQLLNPDRKTADGLEWECPPLVLSIDDMSGNTSKQWNIHYSCYLLNGGLPRASIEKEKNIKLVATSPNASPMEMMQGISDELRPIGLSANYFCRCCHVGGTKVPKESDEGFASLLLTGRPRTVKETHGAVIKQLHLKRVKDARTDDGVKDSLAVPIINKFLAADKAMRKTMPMQRMALSPAETIWILEKTGKFAAFHAKLSSLERAGLCIPNIMAGYMCRYRGSLIGKHFKTIS